MIGRTTQKNIPITEHTCNLVLMIQQRSVCKKKQFGRTTENDRNLINLTSKEPQFSIYNE